MAYSLNKLMTVGCCLYGTALAAMIYKVQMKAYKTVTFQDLKHLRAFLFFVEHANDRIGTELQK
jgi:hypothetical protein